MNYMQMWSSHYTVPSKAIIEILLKAGLRFFEAIYCLPNLKWKFILGLEIIFWNGGWSFNLSGAVKNNYFFYFFNLFICLFF